MQTMERFESHPVNTVHRAGIDRFLNPLRAVAVLTNGPGTSQIRLHHKSVTGDMGAVTAADTNGFIHPDGSITQGSPEKGFTT